MGTSIAFNPGVFLQLFPEFQQQGVTVAQLNMYVGLASQYLRNDGGGPVRTVQEQANLLNLIVAHITALLAQNNGQPPSSLVGRIASASEGSVNVSADMPTNPTEAWFNQTRYGAMFWAGTRQYRNMRYMAPRKRLFYPYRWPY